MKISDGFHLSVKTLLHSKSRIFN